ncbi:MAG: hypothetical protein AAGE85_05975 [Pseudomonadota bacterium]
MFFGRRFYIPLIVLTLAVRAIVPLGYMPGKLLAGEFMVLCPAGSAPSFALLEALVQRAARASNAVHTGQHSTHGTQHAHHAHAHAGHGETAGHAHHGDAGSGMDDRCPIGSALSLLVVPNAETPLSTVRPAPYLQSSPAVVLIAAVRHRGQPVRGPPHRGLSYSS